ncbi:hypothetical protein AUP74_00616 [Microbulbifer aggregans]|uniref:Uncharacterized protein n=1 Tax=Microbulbifer aggregans TaxID=1769779 RepID=A0A1C9W4K4_9GAMM|nr:hypothetical protein [Microbulbifer aggregans]AOS96086.1 hypothetical protein AUP74_00616 [Microbulbifer aggregans]
MTNTKRNGFRGLVFLASIITMMSMNVAYANKSEKHNLLELMKHSESILVGTVKDKEDGFQNGLPFTEITIKVGQNIKGDKGEEYSFRQFGLIKPKPTGDGRINMMVTPAGWPTYSVGENVLLFLHAPASKTGFQTTAGLTQGKFLIRANNISNGLNNDELFAGIKFNRSLKKNHQDLVNQPGGAYAAQDFLSLVRTAVEEKWIENGVMTNE